MMNDTLSNALSCIINAEKVGKTECTFSPCSKVIKKVLEIMKEKKYIGDYEVQDESKGGFVKINLLGNINNCKVIKPRFAVKKEDFEKFEKRFLPASGFGFILISTSKGIMTLEDAREKKIGGKLLAYIY